MIDSHCHRDKQREIETGREREEGGRERGREREREREKERHRASAGPCGMAIVLSCLTVIMVDIDA